MPPAIASAQWFPPPCSPFQDACSTGGKNCDGFAPSAREVHRDHGAQGMEEQCTTNEAGRAEVGLIHPFQASLCFSPKLKMLTDSLPPIHPTQEI